MKSLSMRISPLIIAFFVSFTAIGQEEEENKSKYLGEGSNEKASAFYRSFGFHEPMYAAFGSGDAYGDGTNVFGMKFQFSFLFEVVNFEKRNPDIGDRFRGLDFAYTQTSFWDLQSRSQPFFDSSYKPAFFILYQQVDGDNLSWINRIDLEGGYQHHSNGKAGEDSRSIDQLYLKPSFVWRGGKNYFFFIPRWRYIFVMSSNNRDIEDYWGNWNFELTWRADFGLQIETNTIPAKEGWTFDASATYPLNKLWKPLNFYLFVNYRNGFGDTILRYDARVDGWIIGFAISR